MKQFKYIVIVLLAAFSVTADAQQIPVLDHYIFNPYLYNPARAGESGFGNINLTSRIQWVEMPDAPLTNVISLDMPIKNSNVGIGGMVFSDETHLINNYGAMFTYAYHIPFSDDKSHRLSVGLSAGVLNQRFDYLKANTEVDVDNTLLNETENTVNFDLQAGLNYHYKGLNIGFSVPQVLANSLQYREPANLENVSFGLERHYLVSASYKIQANKDFTVEPLVLARKVSGIPFQVDANVLAGYKETFWLGVGYRSVNSISNASALHASAAVRVRERFNIAYTYETMLDSEARGDLGNSHEITVGYRFGGRTNKEKQYISMLENKIDSIGGQLSILKSDVEEKDVAMNEKVDELSEKVEKGLLDAERLASLQKQVDKNTSDIADLKSNDQAIMAELNAIKEDMSRTKAKLAELEKGGSGSAFFDQMGSIYFDKGSSELNATEKSKLDAIHSNIASQGGRFTLFLSGNASAEGSEQYNMALSMRRANAVKRYLQSKGLNNGSVFLLPYGEEVPAGGVPNTVDKNDRRVDLYITN